MILRLLITVAAVAINGSRSSWVSVAFGIFVFSLLYVITNPRKIGWGIFIIILSALVILGLQFAPDGVIAAFEDRLGTFNRLEQDKSLIFREIMLQKGWKLFQESPVIGVGASRFRKESVELELSGAFAFYAQSKFDYKSAHNSYMVVLAEFGLLGTIPFLILMMTLWLRGFKASLKFARQQRLWALGVYVSLLGMSVHMWTMTAITGTSTWFVFGLAAALIELDRKNLQESNHYTMKLGFYYHVPAIIRNGGIYMPGYQGCFIDNLAKKCEKVVCFFHSPNPSEMGLMDYRIQEENVEWVD